MRLLLFVSVFILAASGTSGSKLVKLHGCYLRRGSGANLKFSVSSSEPMTIESCQKDCSRYTFRYFGVADGTYCFCGNTKPYPKVPLFRCDQKCPGNYYQICGGSNSMVVYEQPATLATASA
uniref:WSC domain-containing protein n=1 Tax=Macrostomum lignano TaxID=282301 RepID=A0A1I8G5H5_9PLAT